MSRSLAIDTFVIPAQLNIFYGDTYSSTIIFCLPLRDIVGDRNAMATVRVRRGCSKMGSFGIPPLLFMATDAPITMIVHRFDSKAPAETSDKRVNEAFE